jgi:hypothetical protein
VPIVLALRREPSYTAAIHSPSDPRTERLGFRGIKEFPPLFTEWPLDRQVEQKLHAGVEDDDTVGKQERFVKVVRDEKHCRASMMPSFLQ